MSCPRTPTPSECDIGSAFSPPTKRTIDDYFKVNFQTNFKEFAEDIVRMVCQNGTPFEQFESPSLRRLLGQQAKKLNFPLHRKGVKSFVLNYADSKRAQLTHILKDKLVYLLVDEATRQLRGFLAINVVYCHEKRLCLRTLAVKAMHGKKKSADLKDFIEITMKKFSINKKNVLAVSADNAAAMKALVDKMNADARNEGDVMLIGCEEDDSAQQSKQFYPLHAYIKDEDVNIDGEDGIGTRVRTRRMLGDEDPETELEENLRTACSALNLIFYQRCGLHTLQLSVKDGLKNDAFISDLLKRVRTAVKLGRNKNADFFCTVAKKIPLLDNQTRWGSTFVILDRLWELREAYK